MLDEKKLDILCNLETHSPTIDLGFIACSRSTQLSTKLTPQTHFKIFSNMLKLIPMKCVKTYQTTLLPSAKNHFIEKLAFQHLIFMIREHMKIKNHKC